MILGVLETSRTQKTLFRIYEKLDRLLEASNLGQIDILRSPRILRFYKIRQILEVLERKIDRALARIEESPSQGA